MGFLRDNAVIVQIYVCIDNILFKKLDIGIIN